MTKPKNLIEKRRIDNDWSTFREKDKTKINNGNVETE